jgi:nucleotide-binding universal stress UspA family protein
MVRAILVAIDGSESALKALDLACEIAVANDARVLLLHAVSSRKSSQEEQGFSELEQVDGEPLQTRDAIAELQIMATARSQARANGVKNVETAVVQGDPAQVIIEHAKDFDMIVMGRRGLGPFKGLMQGSVTQKVSQLSGAACVTVK